MINQIYILLAEESAGGLFDFGATLPFIAVQFLLLMFILNLILYSPLIKLVNQRNEYILDNLGNATIYLEDAQYITKQYEEKLASVKVETQQEIEKTQKLQKENFALSLQVVQKYLNFLLDKFTTNLNQTLNDTYSELENDEVIDTLADDVLTKLFSTATTT
jgi:F-type H+-transporting ATPase subunit b